MKIQNEGFEKQRRLDKECYEKQNERLKKFSHNLYWKKSKAMQILFRWIR